LPPEHPLNQEEWFGPIASIMRARDFEHALELHNRSSFGLLGALYAVDEERIARFVAGAEAGIVSIGRARPALAAAGPFSGWKASAFGTPEHGRWNRDFYTRVQAVYRN
jgi:acyl-CoA reductase-like NAD-dependent aldehyde dehydrogenase